jgi:hypothetical protein
MRLIIGFVTCFCIFQASQILADEPPAQATSQATPAAPASAATSAPSSSATQPASAAKPAASADTDDATDKRLRSQGYKPETRNGAKIYCRKETELGSRFPSKVCGTPEQLANSNKDSQDALDKVQRQSAPVRAN